VIEASVLEYKRELSLVLGGANMGLELRTWANEKQIDELM